MNKNKKPYKFVGRWVFNSSSFLIEEIITNYL